MFIDTGAWIALALVRDPYHLQARSIWSELESASSPLVTSLPVVLETFTFLERNTLLDVALTWKDRLADVKSLRIEPCALEDLEAGWIYFRRKDLHRLSATDAVSFALMKRLNIRIAFAFDHHFAMAGFHLAG